MFHRMHDHRVIGARYVDAKSQLFHVAAARHGARLKNKLRRLGNSHETAHHVGMRDGDETADANLLKSAQYQQLR